MIPTLIILGVLVLIGLWIVGVYNSIKRKEIQYKNAWSDIDVQLKRRYDLVPNLVESVKGYAAHEKETLEAVIAARQTAIDAKSIKETVQAENMLTSALSRLMAVAEAYPDLKANQNFMHLQEELVSTENKIGFARQNYNRTASQYNEAIAVFPAVVIAGMFGFDEAPFFEIDESQKEAPKVEF